MAKKKTSEFATVGYVVNLPLNSLLVEAADRTIDELKDVEGLSQNMLAMGQLTPIIVAKAEDGKHRVIAGKRRAAAAKKLKWDSIRAVVVDVEAKEMPIAIVSDNLFNMAPTSILQARIFKELLDAGVYKNQRELAKASGIDASLISRRLKLLEADETVQDQVEKGLVPQATLLAKSKEQLKDTDMVKISRERSLTKFHKLPSEVFVSSSDGSMAEIKVFVAKEDLKVQFMLDPDCVGKMGLLKAIETEIDRVGDNEIVAAIKKFGREIFQS